ncbi:MAG: hypothetical protein ACK5HY_11675 [Parahaliea sp.]
MVALFCALMVLVVEAAHQHGLGDTNTHCLLCKIPSLLPAVTVATVVAPASRPARPPCAGPRSAPLAQC